MRINEVSKRYAKALLALTKQSGQHEKAMAELTEVSIAFEGDSKIKAYFENPTIAQEQKISVIKATFAGKGMLDDVTNLLLLLAEKGRLNSLVEVVEAFRAGLDEEAGITRGTVQSARPLSPEARKEIEQKIHKVLNKKIILTYQEEPKLLGGVIAQVGGWTFDDSIETHLNKLNEELNRRAN